MQVVSTFKGHLINEQKMNVINVDVSPRTKLQQFQFAVNVTVDNDDFPLWVLDFWYSALQSKKAVCVLQGSR